MKTKKFSGASLALRVLGLILFAAGPAASLAADGQKPTAPSGLAATPINANRIDLSWTKSTDNVGVTAYLVESCQGTSSGTCATNFSQIGTSTGTSFSNTFLLGGMMLRYRVRATDAAGNLSAYSNIASATTPPGAATPTGLTATAVSASRVDLSWTASSGAVSYGIYRTPSTFSDPSCLFAGGLPIGTSTVPSFSDTTIAPATSYCYWVGALDAAGAGSGLSSRVNAPLDTTPPSAPVGLIVTAVGSTQVSLSWGAASDNWAIQRYDVWRCAGAGCTFQRFRQASASGTSFTDTGLTPATSYSYKVATLDTSGNYSTDSNSVSLTTAATGQTVPTALSPNALVLNPGAGGTVTATLSPAPTAAGTLAVSSSNPAAAMVPATVGFASGQTSVSIPVTARAGGSAVIAAFLNNGEATATVNVNAAPTVSITSPANGTVFGSPASFTITATAADADGTVAKVDFFDGATLVGTATAAPYSVALSNIASGAHSYTARATDNNGATTTSAAVAVTVNAAPTVSITAPANNAVFTAPANITVTATASDTDGTIAKVEFFDGAALAGTVTAAPYSVALTNVAGGTHAYTARATDNQGAVTTSAPVNVIVNTPPAVSITAPAAGAVFTAPATITVTANATDADGTIVKVDFFQGTTLIGTATTAPYSATASNLASGSYSFTAVATDNRGGTTTSSAVTVIVNNPPSVSLTAPTAGAIFNTPANITITANAADTDGTVAKVDFYQGTTLLGTSTAAPYSFAWTNVTAGRYSLTAVATDDRSGARTSAAVAITVDAPPTVSLTAPANNAVFAAPASITLAATAGDAVGTITKVDFYQGVTLIGTATASPYSFVWTNVAAGTYSLTAIATNDAGGTTTSAAVAVTVDAAPTASLDAPAASSVYAAPASISLSATASDTVGTVTKVDFYQGATLIGTASAAPYTFRWTNVAPGLYSLSAVATNDAGMTATSSAVSIAVDAPPAVTLTAPASAATFTAPASIPLAASVSDDVGTVTKVDFYRNGTLITSLAAAPYSFTWTGVPAGSYSLTAVATNDSGQTTTSAAVAITVKTGVAQMYFIHPDHLNTPRAITDGSGTVVWQWDQTEPFGNAPPNDNPSGLGAFDYPFRFPGQYSDKETGLFYNYFRDYDSNAGRYPQSDPMGLGGGLNTYAYVDGDPVSSSDPKGLKGGAKGGGKGRGIPVPKSNEPLDQMLENLDFPNLNFGDPLPGPPRPPVPPICRTVCPPPGTCTPPPPGGTPSVFLPGCYRVCTDTDGHVVGPR